MIFDAMRGLEGALTGALFSLFVETTPSSASRPRVSKFGTYYAKSYQVHSADCLKQLALVKPSEPLTGDLVASVEVHIEKPKVTKRVRPPCDVDNLGKAILDAATKAGVWEDDSQVMALLVTKQWATPGTPAGVRLTVGRSALNCATRA